MRYPFKQKVKYLSGTFSFAPERGCSKEGVRKAGGCWAECDKGRGCQRRHKGGHVGTIAPTLEHGMIALDKDVCAFDDVCLIRKR